MAHATITAGAADWSAPNAHNLQVFVGAATAVQACHHLAPSGAGRASPPAVLLVQHPRGAARLRPHCKGLLRARQPSPVVLCSVATLKAMPWRLVERLQCIGHRLPIAAPWRHRRQVLRRKRLHRVAPDLRWSGGLLPHAGAIRSGVPAARLRCRRARKQARCHERRGISAAALADCVARYAAWCVRASALRGRRCRGGCALLPLAAGRRRRYAVLGHRHRVLRARPGHEHLCLLAPVRAGGVVARHRLCSC